MTSDALETAPGLWHRFMGWASRVELGNKLAVLLALAAIAAGFATYAALTDTPPFGTPDPRTVTILLTLDLIILLLLGALIARRIVHIWILRRRGLAGSQLHIRLVALFSVIAVAPAIIVATFATFFFFVGVEEWFSDRVRTAVNESIAVARAYLHEHQKTIRADVLAMANDLNQEAMLLLRNPERFESVVSTQAALRGLAESVVFDGTTMMTVAQSPFSFSLTLDLPSQDDLGRARQGEVVLFVNDADDRVRALVRLDRFVDTFLYVGRLVEPLVLSHIETAQTAFTEYTELEGRRSSLQITVTMIFVVVCLLLLLASVWTGLIFASQLAHPVSALIGAAERVRAGDLAVRVAEADTGDELTVLSRAFNRMTRQIESQQRELVEANRQLDLRRRFTEAVLAGVSAGVLGLDQDGVINLPNQSAAVLLGEASADALVGRPLTEAVPEMAPVLEGLQRRSGRMIESQIELRRSRTPKRTLLVRIAAEIVGDEIRGFVVTFDDISELLAAQRKAAWADVARRIAHEIKNPLTPIQLSAERLRRKYLKEIESDKETFQICTDTIVRHVLDIGRMVDEFSAFARMPSPVMKEANIHDLCRQAVFLQTTAHPAIRFRTDLPADRLVVACDARQISQALTNLLQNAVEAVQGREPGEDGTALPAGEITVAVRRMPDALVISVEDNGKGLPHGEERQRLTEPYVTTRPKGTGLGLAIVRKIMEDHGGDLTLQDRSPQGARVALHIPLTRQTMPNTAAVEITDPSPAPDQKALSHGA